MGVTLIGLENFKNGQDFTSGEVLNIVGILVVNFLLDKRNNLDCISFDVGNFKVVDFLGTEILENNKLVVQENEKTDIEEVLCFKVDF